MLGINQYRQRLPGEPVFNTGASQVAAKALPVSSGAVSNSDPGSAVNSGGQVSPSEIISSLAGIRETLQGEPAATKPELKKPVVAPIKIEKSLSLEESEKSPTPITQQAAQPDIPEPLEEPENISFTLACWQVSDEILVINGFAHGERADRTQLELLANILRAIGQLSSNLPAAELIEWPLSPSAESTLAGAKTQLSMFLLGRQQVRPYRWLLAMGDEPARLLAKDDAASPPESDSAETLFIPSLQAMLAEPLCKREVWQALRHLRG
ncbi:MAG: hypothetical protein DRQ64_02400, partial [Gammaproteobacteria bacterium]